MASSAVHFFCNSPVRLRKAWLNLALDWLFTASQFTCLYCGEIILKWEKASSRFTKQTNISAFSSPFSHFPRFAHRFLALPCKIMLYLLSKGRDQSSIVSAIKKGLTTGERWLCYAVALLSLCRNTPIEMHEGILGFGERPTALWNWAALVSGTKSEVVSVFCHWRSPQLSPDSCGLPPTVLWGWLFLNKWVYDSDFLLPLLSLSLIWNSTHPSERAQSSCCLSLHFTCATWLGVGGGGSVSPPYEKPVATPILNRAWIFVQILH